MKKKEEEDKIKMWGGSIFWIMTWDVEEGGGCKM